MLPSDNCEMAMLLALVKNRKKEGYNLHELAKKTSIEKDGEPKIYSYPAVRKYMPELVKKGLVKKIREGTYHGHKTTWYDITIMGMMTSFLRHDILKSMYRISRAFENELPLVFGKWDYFIEQGAKDIITKHLVKTMQICAFEYQRFLDYVKEYPEAKDRRYFPFFKRHRERWMKERAWATRITDLFLYYALETEYLMQFSREGTLGKSGYGDLSYEETSKLKSVIDRDKNLHLYKMMLQRRDAEKHLEKSKRYQHARPEFFRMPIKIEERLRERLLFRLVLKHDPYNEIIDAVFDEDFFTAALKLTEQYVGFPFEAAKEAVAAVPQFLLNLLRMRNPILDLAMMEAERKHEKYPDDVKEYLDEVSLKAMAAQYFYDFKSDPVKVWDLTFYQIFRQEKRLEKLKNEPKKAKAVALEWARIMREVLETPKDSKLAKDLIVEVDCYNCPFSETCSYAQPDFCPIRDKTDGKTVKKAK